MNLRLRVLNTIREAIAVDSNFTADQITEEMRPIEDLRLDSLDLLEVLVAVEVSLLPSNIDTLDDDAIAGLGTIGEMCDEVVKQLRLKGVK